MSSSLGHRVTVKIKTVLKIRKVTMKCYYSHQKIMNGMQRCDVTCVCKLHHKHCICVTIASVCFAEPHLSGSACVMSMRGRVEMGRLEGLVQGTGSSSGVSDLTLSLSLSTCRHDNGGSCRLPENRLWTLHTSTPSVLPLENCPTEGSLKKKIISLLRWCGFPRISFVVINEKTTADILVLGTQ